MDYKYKGGFAYLWAAMIAKLCPKGQLQQRWHRLCDEHSVCEQLCAHTMMAILTLSPKELEREIVDDDSALISKGPNLCGMLT